MTTSCTFPPQARLPDDLGAGGDGDVAIPGPHPDGKLRNNRLPMETRPTAPGSTRMGRFGVNRPIRTVALRPRTVPDPDGR
jgi:hypothetical protein